MVPPQTRTPALLLATALVAVLFAAAGPLAGCGRSERTGPPNVLLYVVDTLRADALGCYGNQVVATPAIDAFALESTVFEQAFAQSSWTRASMASLLTSAHPPLHGAETRETPLAHELVLLSEVLRDAGYTTGCFTTNPNIGSFFGFDQGFDTFVELYDRRDTGKVRTKELTTTSEEVTREVARWVDAVPEPFFLLVLTIDPHSPYGPPPEFDVYGGDYAGDARGTSHWIDRNNLSEADKQRIRSLYWGEVSFNDRSFGELVEHLRDEDLLDDTLAIFTSDHGEELWEHGRRGHGRSLVDTATRVPLIVREPRPAGQRLPAARVTRPVELVDVFPTVLAVAGVPLPGSAADAVEGRPLLGAPAAPRVATFSALTLDGHELLSWRTKRWKLVLDLQTGEQRLHDLSRPDAEDVDVSADHPEECAELKAALAEHVGSLAARRAALGVASGSRSLEDMPPGMLETLKALGYVDDD